MRLFMSALAAVVMLAMTAVPGSAAGTKTHRVSIQVDQNDPALMNLALNNATNIMEQYKSKDEAVEVEIVTYGPGLHMFRADTSPVQDRIKRLASSSFPATIKFSACGNTKQGMEKVEGKSISLIPEASVVPSGAVRLVQLQEEGWSYLRP